MTTHSDMLRANIERKRAELRDPAALIRTRRRMEREPEQGAVVVLTEPVRRHVRPADLDYLDRRRVPVALLAGAVATAAVVGTILVRRRGR
jgi:hypothetical protein